MIARRNKNYVRTCRHCLGHDCIHCENKGRHVERVFRRFELSEEEKRALAWLKSGVTVN